MHSQKLTVHSAIKIVGNNFDNNQIRERLESVKFKILKQKILQKEYNVGFGKEFRALALYDPNKHTVFYNAKILKYRSKKLMKEVIVHELIHAISDHKIIKNGSQVILKSGLKKQYSSLNDCQFRALNEGLVQYLCNKILGYESKTYREEADFAERLIKIVGEEKILAVFFGQTNFQIEEVVSQYMKDDLFLEASRLLDDYNFNGALMLLPEKESSQEANLQPIPASY